MSIKRIGIWAVAGGGLLLPAAAFAADAQFVALTQIPAFTEVANSGDIGTFFQTLYKLAIGAAAVLAVIQIMRAGIMYMSPDSVAEKSEARNLISLSVFGLILVLSPVIVFGIIDKRILNIGFDLAPLSQNASTAAENSGSPAGTAASNTANEITFPVKPNWYLIMTSGVMAGAPNCTTLAGDIYETQEGCTAALASWRKSSEPWANWSFSAECKPLGKATTHTMKGTNLCVAQDHIPK